MIKHIVFTRFRDPAVNIPEAEGRLRALVGVIPEIRSLETGRDLLHSDRSYDFALIVTFDDLDALRRYDAHPAHRLVRDYIRENRTASATVDFTF